MISHELAKKLLEGPDLKVLVAKYTEGIKEGKFLESAICGSKGVPKDYEVSEEYKEIRDKLAKDDPYEEVVMLF